MNDNQKWTREPWHVIPCPQWRKGLARIDRSPSVPWANFGEIAYASKANAHRIVQCVNALAEIENPGAVGELVEALKDIATSDERGICGSGYSAQRIAIDALAALGQKEISE